jgi:hypothetical protein
MGGRREKPTCDGDHLVRVTVRRTFLQKCAFELEEDETGPRADDFFSGLAADVEGDDGGLIPTLSLNDQETRVEGSSDR